MDLLGKKAIEDVDEMRNQMQIQVQLRWSRDWHMLVT